MFFLQPPIEADILSVVHGEKINVRFAKVEISRKRRQSCLELLIYIAKFDGHNCHLVQTFMLDKVLPLDMLDVSHSNNPFPNILVIGLTSAADFL